MTPLTLAVSIFRFPLWPPAASPGARVTDTIFIGLIVATGIVAAGIAVTIFYFCYKYRAGSPAKRTPPLSHAWRIEATWIAIPTMFFLGMFVWAAEHYFVELHPPADATPIFVVGKQWMWKVEHPDGRREVDELHVPTGKPIKVMITSEDVIHSFFLPAFRLKMDAVPSRYTQYWFVADTPGTYHLFCSEYCGTNHARMQGKLVVMKPADFQRWLTLHPPAPTVQPTVRTSSASWITLGCAQCHRTDTDSIAPRLEGLFGTKVKLTDGRTVIADEDYIRESILNPAAKVVAGYPAIMPTYAGLVTPEQLNQLVEAVKALKQDASIKEPLP